MMSGFRTQSCRQDGSREWEITGAKADVLGVLAELAEVELTLYLRDGDPVLITSPACSFNQARETGTSGAPIHVRSKSFQLDGVGYDVLAGQQRLHVRSRVRMKIQKARSLLEQAVPSRPSASEAEAR